MNWSVIIDCLPHTYIRQHTAIYTNQQTYIYTTLKIVINVRQHTAIYTNQQTYIYTTLNNCHTCTLTHCIYHIIVGFTVYL